MSLFTSFTYFTGRNTFETKKRFKLNKIGAAMLAAGVICTGYTPIHMLQAPLVAQAAENQSDSLS